MQLPKGNDIQNVIHAPSMHCGCAKGMPKRFLDTGL